MCDRVKGVEMLCYVMLCFATSEASYVATATTQNNRCISRDIIWINYFIVAAWEAPLEMEPGEQGSSIDSIDSIEQ